MIILIISCGGWVSNNDNNILVIDSIRFSDDTHPFLYRDKHTDMDMDLTLISHSFLLSQLLITSYYYYYYSNHKVQAHL